MRVLPDVSALGPARSEEILRPVKPSFILLTLFIALLANIVPIGPGAAALRPDVLALVLLYWCIREPRYVGVGTAWFVGLIMDVADATVFGQHALAYAVLAYAADYFRRRVLRFPLWQQAVQVAAVPRWTYVVPPLVGALLWPVLSVLLQYPQRPTRSSKR